MPETPTTSRSRTAPAPRVVVADDNVDISRLLALMLRSRGFDAVVAPGGDAALAAILSDGADALVSDFEMPGLDGLRLCRILRSLRAYIALPIVMFTALRMVIHVSFPCEISMSFGSCISRWGCVKSCPRSLR